MIKTTAALFAFILFNSFAQAQDCSVKIINTVGSFDSKQMEVIQADLAKKDYKVVDQKSSAAYSLILENLPKYGKILSLYAEIVMDTNNPSKNLMIPLSNDESFITLDQSLKNVMDCEAAASLTQQLLH